MSVMRRRLVSFLVAAAVRAGRASMDRAELERRAGALDFETDARRLGARVTEFLRDRLRRTWLKARSDR